MSEGICEDRVVIVTGAGRGLGRAHALELAREGAKVVVNDFGRELDGTPSADNPAHELVSEIQALGGDAVVSGADVADWAEAGAMVQLAIDTWGHIDAIVNNAGVVRDRMFANASEDEWDLTMRVHLKGHFCAARHAAGHWRDVVKGGGTVDGRIVNTTSGAGLMGSVGQSAYSAAKAGIAGLTIVQAAELGRYGVTANGLAPSARTRMTEGVFAEMMAAPDDADAFDAMAPENVSPLVAWLVSADSADVTGRMFESEGGKISVADGWQHGTVIDNGARWNPGDLGAAVRELIAGGPAPAPVYGA